MNKNAWMLKREHTEKYQNYQWFAFSYMIVCSAGNILHTEMDNKIDFRNEHQKQLEVQKLSVWGSTENIGTY